MAEPGSAQEQSICEMYRDGSSFRTLELAFGMSTEEIIGVLHRNGVVQQEEGESWQDFVARIKEDVGHTSAA